MLTLSLPRLGIPKLIAVAFLAMAMLAAAAMPSAEVIPVEAKEAISAVIPDPLESLFGAQPADAGFWGTVWSVTTSVGSMAGGLYGLGTCAIGAALCLGFAAFGLAAGVGGLSYCALTC